MMKLKVALPGAALALIGWGCSAALAVDPPDVRINPSTGLIETVDATWSGTNYDVRHTVVNNQGLLLGTSFLSINPINDLDPSIALTSGGDAYVAWWRDSLPNVVLYRVRIGATGKWGAERTVGLGSESNSRPRTVYDGTHVWVAYQIQSSKEQSVGCQIIDDTPEPFGAIVGTTTYPGDLDVQISFEAGHLWVTWIDAGSRVGYSEYLREKRLWEAPAYESFASDSATAARARIRVRILGVALSHSSTENP